MKVKMVFLTSMLMALCLVLMGCGGCPRTDSNGVTTKNVIPNCLEKAQDTVCNPPQAVKDIVQAAIPLIVAALNVAVPGSSEWINAQTALNEAQSIKEFGCLAVTSLNNLISYINTTLNQPASGMAKAAAPSVQPLIDWRNSHLAISATMQ